MEIAWPFLSPTASFREMTARRLFPSTCQLTVMSCTLLFGLLIMQMTPAVAGQGAGDEVPDCLTLLSFASN